MTRILIVNPNTSDHMTESIRRTVEAISQPPFVAMVERVQVGPESLESFYEYSLATLSALELLKNRPRDYDGVLLACFGDPGLFALKEYCDVPVIGIAEASMALSTLLGHKFAILVARQKAISMMDSMVLSYGLRSRPAGIFALNMPVLSLEDDPQRSLLALEHLVDDAVRHGAEVIILGYAGMTVFREELSRRLGVTIVDPIVAGYTVLQALLSARIPISRSGLYQSPPDKRMVGELLCRSLVLLR